MKKIISIVLLLVFFQLVNAQAKFGLKAGLNVSSLTSKEGNDQLKTLVGGNIGLFSNINISSNLSFQPEIIFSGEGARITAVDLNDPNGSNSGTGRLVFSYINIPLLLKFAKYSTSIYGELGPQIGILASASAKSFGESIDIKDFFKATNFSLCFGAGYNFSESLAINTRYNVGLSNIATSDLGSGLSGNIKTSNLSIGLQYTFQKKRK